MEYDINSLKEFGIDPDTGIAYTGSMDKFISALEGTFSADDDQSFDPKCVEYPSRVVDPLIRRPRQDLQ